MKRAFGLILALVMILSCVIAGPGAIRSQAASGRQDPLPDHLVIGYWHNFINGSSNLKLRDVPSYYDLVCIAFTENTAVGGRGTFSVDPDLAVALGGYTKEEMIQDVERLHARGQHVIISVGGALGRISIKNEVEAQNFADSMTQIIREYHLDGIDIDLEGGSVSATAYIASSLRTLHNTFGKDFIITMAPETLYIENAQRPYAKLLMEVKDILTMVFPQFYNTGCMEGYDGQMVNRSTADMMTSMSTTLIERFGLRDDQIAFGVPNNPKSAGSGYYTYSETKLAVNAFMNGTKANKFKAPRAYPGFRGMMAWSVNWDNTTNYAWAKSMSALMDEVSGYAPKGAPASAPAVKIEAGEERVKLSWNPVPGAESYEVYDASGKLLVNTSCDFYVVPHLENGKSYSFTVKAANSAGTSAKSAAVSATPKDFPDVYPFYEDFKATKEYRSGGTRVNYKGNVYENKYYTAGSSPEGNDAWKLIGPYLYNGDGFGNGGSAGNTPSPDPIEVISVTLDKTRMELEVGKKGALKATVLPANAEDQAITWTTSDAAVAAVKDGKVTAVAEGTAVITATSVNGKTAKCTVTVTAVPETTVPETTVPETTVPETTVPETTVPETTVPETTVPETTVPETTVPETTVPETTAPETQPVDPDLSGDPWTPGVSYVKGDVVSYANKLYTCRQPHTALKGWEPTDAPALWLEGGSVAPTDPEPTVPETTVPETTAPETTEPETTAPAPTVPSEVTEWKANTAYATGDLVTYKGVTYSCVQGHTALGGWEPCNVPALWAVK